MTIEAEAIFRRMSQTIKNAERPTTEEAAHKAQDAAAIVVNNPLEAAIGSLKGVKVKHTKRQGDGRETAFDKAANLLGDAIQKARAEKLETIATNRETDTEKPEAKTLAQLLTESAQDSE